MQKLPWFPRPLIIFTMIGEKSTPCVQWHGQDSEGNVSEEQMLFPIYGREAQYIEMVRPDFWRVSFLGNMSVWNEKYPDRPYARAARGKVVKGPDVPIVRMISNELFSHDTFVLSCPVIQCGEDGLLYSPAVYDNPDAYDELPRHEIDRDLQINWRNLYKGLGRFDSNIREAVEGMYPGYPRWHARKYVEWLEEQHQREEEYRWG